MAGPALTHCFDLSIALGPTLELGRKAGSRRFAAAVEDGHFTGPYASGTVRPGGADWQTVRADGIADIELHCSLETDDGVVIAMRLSGRREAGPELADSLRQGAGLTEDARYFRASVRFELQGDRYPELSRRMFLATGIRRPEFIGLQIFQVN